MDQRAFELRMTGQRSRLRVSPEQLLQRIERSPYGPRSKEILRQHVTSESTGQVGFALFDCPPVIVRGSGALVWDADGKEYVDMLAGFSVSNVGHCHPAIVAAVNDQAGKLLHYFDLPNEPRERLAGRLAALAPGDRAKRVAFGVTGADAVELAIRLGPGQCAADLRADHLRRDRGLVGPRRARRDVCRDRAVVGGSERHLGPVRVPTAGQARRGHRRLLPAAA